MHAVLDCLCPEPGRPGQVVCAGDDVMKPGGHAVSTRGHAALHPAAGPLLPRSADVTAGLPAAISPVSGAAPPARQDQVPCRPGGASPPLRGGVTTGRRRLARRGTARSGSGRTEPMPASRRPDLAAGCQVNPYQDDGDGMKETDQELDTVTFSLPESQPGAPRVPVRVRAGCSARTSGTVRREVCGPSPDPRAKSGAPPGTPRAACSQVPPACLACLILEVRRIAGCRAGGGLSHEDADLAPKPCRRATSTLAVQAHQA